MRFPDLLSAFALVLGFLASSLHAKILVLNDDGGWNWLQDERVIVAGGKLVVASVAMGTRDPSRKGDVEVASYDLRTGEIRKATLHHAATPELKKGWSDDHSCPALVMRPDGRVLAMYTETGQNEKLHYRISTSSRDFAAWEEEQVFSVTAGSRLTFVNLHYVPQENGGKGRLLSFFRGIESKNMPSWAFSDDLGRSWSAGNVFITAPSTNVPYVKYAGNGRDTVHLAFTDGHRWSYHNSVFHLFYRNGQLYRSDGRLIRSIREGLKSADEATRIYQANAESVVMSSDLCLDAKGHPCIGYSVQKDSARLNPMPIGLDHRYRYARWTGTAWVDYEIAHAGREVHPVGRGDDCTGLIALDPQDPSVVYISTDADPVRGTPLISAADNKRHWEIFRGKTSDGGASWNWTPVTGDSDRDNIRPVVPAGLVGKTAVIWLRGTMRHPKDYDLEVVGLVTDSP